jgi:hypothetical protein
VTWCFEQNPSRRLWNPQQFNFDCLVSVKLRCKNVFCESYNASVWPYGVYGCILNECLSLQRRWYEEIKPVICYTVVYWTCDSLNMFRAILCPSSGAWDYTDVHSMWHITLVISGLWSGAWL